MRQRQRFLGEGMAPGDVQGDTFGSFVMPAIETAHGDALRLGPELDFSDFVPNIQIQQGPNFWDRLFTGVFGYTASDVLGIPTDHPEYSTLRNIFVDLAGFFGPPGTSFVLNLLLDHVGDLGSIEAGHLGLSDVFSELHVGANSATGTSALGSIFMGPSVNIDGVNLYIASHIDGGGAYLLSDTLALYSVTPAADQGAGAVDQGGRSAPGAGDPAMTPQPAAPAATSTPYVVVGAIALVALLHLHARHRAGR
jgi:hypothetical protein